MKILLLSRYSIMGASSRLRFIQYIPYLLSKKIYVELSPLFSDKYLSYQYMNGRKSLLISLFSYIKRFRVCLKISNFDLIWVEKECFPMLPSLFERLPLLRKIPYVVDYDDAIHHNYDMSNNIFIKYILKNKLQKFVLNAKAIVVGNQYLSSWAISQGAKCIVFIPTVIDLVRYKKNLLLSYKSNNEFRVGWIGMPATTEYLLIVRNALQIISTKIKLRLVLIGAKKLENYGVPLEYHSWSSDTEIEILNTLDVGIMPLYDSHWEKGKCGYKLIQYMACGLPVVASPVGVNSEIVEHGINGMLADDTDQWCNALITLFNNDDLRIQMGLNGRKKIEENYSLQSKAILVESLLKSAANFKN